MKVKVKLPLPEIGPQSSNLQPVILLRYPNLYYSAHNILKCKKPGIIQINHILISSEA